MELQEYLDGAITLWRDVRDGKTPAPQGRIDLAEAYIDAFQSVRLSMLGELLPTPDGEDPTRIADSPGPHVEVEGVAVPGAPLWTSEEVHELATTALGRISVSIFQSGSGVAAIGYGTLATMFNDALRAEITERCAPSSSSQ